MIGKTHLAVGEAAALWILQPKDPLLIVPVVFGAAIGSLVADVDIPSSTASKATRKIILACIFGSFVGLGISKLIGDNILGHFTPFVSYEIMIRLLIFLLFLAFSMSRPHREFTHSILALILTSLILSGIVYGLSKAVFIGYLSHLIIDYPNKKGESLLWPLPKKYCLNLCTSNGIVSKILFSIAILLSILYLGFIVITL